MIKPIFIFANQRSGTNLLRRSLATTETFIDFDEIFDPRKPGYWSYCERLARAQPHLLNPTGRKIHRFENCLTELLNASEVEREQECKQADLAAPFGLIDIKYNSAHALNDLGHIPFDQPDLIRWLITKQFPVIHLVRQNCLENYVSFLVGTKTQNWVVPKDCSQEERPSIRLRLDVDETLFQLRRRQQQIRTFRSLLSRANCLELQYESLTGLDGEFSQVVVNRVTQLVGIEQRLEVDVTTKKTGRPLSEVIVNLNDEIAPALRAAGLEEFLPKQDCVVPTGERTKRSSAAISQPPATQPATTATNGPSKPIQITAQAPLEFVPRIERYPARTKFAFVLTPDLSQYDDCEFAGEHFAGEHFAGERFAGGNLGAKVHGQLSVPCVRTIEPFSQRSDSFWNFRGRLQAAAPELAVPTLQNQIEVWERYVDRQLALADYETPGRGLLVFRLDYRQTFHLNEAWYHLAARPLLLNWLVEQRLPIVHLIERDGTETSSASNQSRCQQRLRPIQIEAFRGWLAPAETIEVESVPIVWNNIIDQLSGQMDGSVSHTSNGLANATATTAHLLTN